MDFLNSFLNGLFNSASPISTFLSVVRAIVAVALVFFLPGFAWTLVFFKKIHAIERIALSVGLSIAIVTLSILFLNLAVGIRITALTSIATILVITAVPLAIYYVNKLVKQSKGKEKSN